MIFAQLFLILVVAIPLIAVSCNRLRIDLAALLIAVSLGLGQVLGLGLLGPEHTPQDAIKAFSGLSEPAVLTLLSLFIITQSLHKSGATRWLASRLIELGAHSERRLIMLYAASTALLSLFMNNLAAGALLLPSAMETCRRTGIKPSKLLIPVAYGSLLGGSATYFTTANIIVSNLLASAHPPQAMLHILDFTPTGSLIALAGIAFLGLFGPRLLPERLPPSELMMARYTASDLENYYQLGERLWEAVVLPNSSVANKSLAESRIGEQLGLAVAGIWHGRQAIFSPLPEQVIQPGDILLVVGREERVQQLTRMGMKIGRENTNEHISARGVSLIEALPAPHSSALGHNLRELEFRTQYGFTVLALYRSGRSYRTDVGDFKLMLGDSLLMIGSREKLKRLRNSPDFIVLEPDPGDQPVQRLPAVMSVGVIAAGIVASILGLPVHFSMLAGALLLLLSGMLSMEETYRAIDWQAIFLIAGMYSVSLAMVHTGLAQRIGEVVVTIVTPLGPLGLAAGAYLLTGLLTQVMGGQVTALVTGPIMISAAISLHTNPQAVAVATAIGCSASFLTPLAHPVNVLMIAPANYEFGDFFHIGWRLTIVCFIALLIGLIVFWRLA
ncbi:MAG: SLC13 family permease [Anaerolineae bacterium]|jgi:di/tricarboxylate transporter|nr:SLC13 family permease [Anaerolineae bacterium]MDH7475351.1 SLC13 family permease [Anaerolineae bacterium]